MYAIRSYYALAGRISARLVMGIAVTDAIAEFGHQPGRGIAQMGRHLVIPQLTGISYNFV